MTPIEAINVLISITAETGWKFEFENVDISIQENVIKISGSKHDFDGDVRIIGKTMVTPDHRYDDTTAQFKPKN